MILLTDTARNVVEHGSVFSRYARIESWYDGNLIADDIPILDAVEEQDSTLRVPERLTFTVPVLDGDKTWVPLEYSDPLNAMGQRVRVSLGVGVGSDGIEWINRGWFLINSATTDGDAVRVECLGLMALLDEAVLPTEYQPRSGATLSSVVRALVEPGLTVNDDDAPTDRSVPSSITWSDNRLDAVLSVMDAWPATIGQTEDGVLAIEAPPVTPVAAAAVLTLTDGRGGTVISASAAVTREGGYNSVVAKGQYPDTDATRAGQEIIQAAHDTSPNSPYRMGGPFSPYMVPYGFASPLMTTAAQVGKAALTILVRLRKNASRKVEVTCVPHPGIQLGDVVLLTSTRLGLTSAVGTVDGFQLPYLAADGAMTLIVRLEG